MKSGDLISGQVAIKKRSPQERLIIAKTLIEGVLDELPSTESEIIFCKDCKHRPVDGEDTQGFGVEFPDEKCPCQCEDGWYNWRPDDEWFCANAERRTDD